MDLNLELTSHNEFKWDRHGAVAGVDPHKNILPYYTQFILWVVVAQVTHLSAYFLLLSVGLKINHCQVEIQQKIQSWPPPQINYCLVEIQSQSQIQIWSWHPHKNILPYYTQFILWVVVAQVTCLSTYFLLLSIGLKNKLLSHMVFQVVLVN